MVNDGDGRLMMNDGGGSLLQVQRVGEQPVTMVRDGER